MKTETTENRDIEGLLSGIREGDKEGLKRVYLEHREAFLAWVQKHFHCKEEDALDVYQEVIIAFFENVVDGKVTTLRSSLRTYLFGIGKNMIIKSLNRDMRFQVVAELPEGGHIAEDWEKKWELTGRQRVLRKAVQELGGSCRRLLELYYYRRYATESIMREMGYQNLDVVKSQKSRCMRSLRQLIRDRYEEELR